MEAKGRKFLLRRRHGIGRVTTDNTMVCLLLVERSRISGVIFDMWPEPGEDMTGGAILGHGERWRVFGPNKDKANQSTASTVFIPTFYLFV